MGCPERCLIYPISARYQAAISTGHTALTRVEAWRDGVGQVIPDLAYSSGEVTLDGTSGGVRGTLSLTAARDQGDILWDILAPIGTEIVPYRGIRFIDGSTEWIPLGVFGVDSQRQTYGVDGTIDLTCPDRWARVQRARFLSPATTNGNAVTEAIRLTTGAVSIGYSNTTTSAATTKSQVWDDLADTITPRFDARERRVARPDRCLVPG